MDTLKLQFLIVFVLTERGVALNGTWADSTTAVLIDRKINISGVVSDVGSYVDPGNRHREYLGQTVVTIQGCSANYNELAFQSAVREAVKQTVGSPNLVGKIQRVGVSFWSVAHEEILVAQ